MGEFTESVKYSGHAPEYMNHLRDSGNKRQRVSVPALGFLENLTSTLDVEQKYENMFMMSSLMRKPFCGTFSANSLCDIRGKRI